jgi:hypothetical protein
MKLLTYHRQSNKNIREFKKVIKTRNISYTVRFYLRYPDVGIPYVVVPGIIKKEQEDIEFVEPIAKKLQPNITNEIKKSFEQNNIATGENIKIIFWQLPKLYT